MRLWGEVRGIWSSLCSLVHVSFFVSVARWFSMHHVREFKQTLLEVVCFWTFHFTWIFLLVVLSNMEEVCLLPIKTYQHFADLSLLSHFTINLNLTDHLIKWVRFSLKLDLIVQYYQSTKYIYLIVPNILNWFYVFMFEEVIPLGHNISWIKTTCYSISRKVLDFCIKRN